MFLSTAFSLRHASWKDKCDVHRNISYGFQLLTLITTGQSCGDRSHRALLLMTHQVLCYTEVSPIRKFVSNDRKFRPLERSMYIVSIVLTAEAAETDETFGRLKRTFL